MPTTTAEMLSVAEVCELQPGDANNPTWINPGFTGVVRHIENKFSQKSGKNFWPTTIADTTGSATIEVTFFTAPRFEVGDLIELRGRGLRRTEYEGNTQAAIGKDTEIHVLGKSAHHEEQVERAATSQPAINGKLQPVNGQTVGMAMKEALAIMTRNMAEGSLSSPLFWAAVHEVASDIIRVSKLLEHGKLAASVKDRNAPPAGEPARREPARVAAPVSSGRSDPPRAATRPQAGPDGSVALGKDLEEDVPF